MPFVHELRVRYGECDMQGVVFNANYLAYVDDAIDRWFAWALHSDGSGDGFDCMVKKATIEWSSPATRGEVLSLAPIVVRWGTTSFDVVVDGRVGERPVFTSLLVYVSVTPGGTDPCPVPDAVRSALG